MAGLKKQLDQDESICKAAVDQAADSLKKVKEDMQKFIKKWQSEFQKFDLKVNKKVFGKELITGEIVEWKG